MEVPIDTLGWEFIVQTVEEFSIVEKPSSGVYVRGLYLEGAGWDKKNACLIEPQPMQLISNMPLIHFKPCEQAKKRTKGKNLTNGNSFCIFNINFFRNILLSCLLLSR